MSFLGRRIGFARDKTLADFSDDEIRKIVINNQIVAPDPRPDMAGPPTYYAPILPGGESVQPRDLSDDSDKITVSSSWSVV
jgi:hypothetical protein